MNTKTTTVKTVKTVKATKSSGNTPIKATAVSPIQGSTGKTYALQAGMVVSITHKGLNKAISYHCTKGNLLKTGAGIQLTAQGATAWTKERVEKNSTLFQDIAKFVHGNAPVPKAWVGQPVTSVAENTKFPNMLFWGSFTTSDMRLAFASLWASTK